MTGKITNVNCPYQSPWEYVWNTASESSVERSFQTWTTDQKHTLSELGQVFPAPWGFLWSLTSWLYRSAFGGGGGAHLKGRGAADSVRRVLGSGREVVFLAWVD